MTRKLHVFISYAHRDEPFKDALDMHLSMLKRSDRIATWHDRAILPSSEWDEEIKRQLEGADLILLLISAAFMASDYIWHQELTRAMQRHKRGEARVVPIFIKECDWQGAPFGKVQGLPRDAQPVADADNDRAWSEVAKGIRALADHLLSQPAPAASGPDPEAAYDEGVRQQMALLTERLNRIRATHALETDPSLRLKYEHQMEELERELADLRAKRMR